MLMAIITLVKTDTIDPVVVGTPFSYLLTVTNLGPDTATGLVLTDLLPATVTFNSSSVACTPVGTTLTCPLPNLAPGASQTVTITVTPNAPGTITDVAAVVGSNTNVATDVETTQVILAADLAVTKTANATAQVNQGLTYTVTVTNNGPSTATGVTLVDTLPAGVRFISATPTQGTCILTGTTLTCLIGTLLPGQTKTVTILVVPLRPGTLTNTATVSGNEFDPNLANNTATSITIAIQCCPPPCCCCCC
jgi:uncharacterized repeat protein (TIGR01451 family)